VVLKPEALLRPTFQRAVWEESTLEWSCSQRYLDSQHPLESVLDSATLLPSINAGLDASDASATLPPCLPK
jgi:hypothetical protein